MLLFRHQGWQEEIDLIDNNTNIHNFYLFVDTLRQVPAMALMYSYAILLSLIVSNLIFPFSELDIFFFIYFEM